MDDKTIDDLVDEWHGCCVMTNEEINKRIDDLIHEWHENGPMENRPLWVAIGMTKEEYQHWVKTCEVPSRLKKEFEGKDISSWRP